MSPPVATFVDVLFPVTCVLCARPGVAVCRVCQLRLPEVRLQNSPTPPGLDRFAARFSYEGPAREVVSGLKYRNRRASVRWFGQELAGVVPGVPDLITWVPTTDARRRRRGFDQSRLLAARLAAELRRPCQPTLWRHEGPPQTGRSGADRRHGPGLSARGRLDGAVVLLVDDVVTTGATMASAAVVLRAEAGAAEVWGVALARTPLKAAAGRADP